MISCEDLAEHRDAYDGRHDRLRKGKHSSLTGFHMGKAGGVQEEWSQGGNESQQQRMKYCKAAGGRHSSDFANMTERKQRERCDHKCVEGHGQLAVFFYGNASEDAVKTIAQTRSEIKVHPPTASTRATAFFGVNFSRKIRQDRIITKQGPV